jgi:hypothetical protein
MSWCFFGALRPAGIRREASEQDTGLWLSAAGWLLLALGLFAKYIVVTRAQPDAYATAASSPFTPLCIVLGVLCLLLGGAVCWLAWLHEEETE